MEVDKKGPACAVPVEILLLIGEFLVCVDALLCCSFLTRSRSMISKRFAA